MEIADAELVRRARAADKDAFGCLVERYWPMMRGIALRMVADPDLAQELVQESVLQAYLSLAHLHADARFRSWLYGIVLNVCRSYLRAARADPLSLEALDGGRVYHGDLFADMQPGPEEIAETRDLHRRVMQAVNALSPADRDAVLLFYCDGLSLREAALVLGASVGAVKVRLHKARSQLRQRLLPLYPEWVVAERSKPMIPVRLLEGINLLGKMQVQTQDDPERQFVVRPPATHHIMLLFDEAGRRVLPVWIGTVEGAAIQMALKGEPTQRPLTLDFMANVLNAAGAKVEAVQVSALKEETYYATVRLRSGATIQEIDARPSDAVGLAVRMDTPIFVAEDVLEKAAIATPDDFPDGLYKRIEERRGEGQRTFIECTTEGDKAMQEMFLSLIRGETPPS